MAVTATEFDVKAVSAKVTFILDSGKLIARHFRTGDVLLNLTKPDQFSGNKWYFRNVVFTRDSSGTIAGCNVSCGRVRNLKFEKAN